MTTGNGPSPAGLYTQPRSVRPWLGNVTGMAVLRNAFASSDWTCLVGGGSAAFAAPRSSSQPRAQRITIMGLFSLQDASQERDVAVGPDVLRGDEPFRVVVERVPGVLEAVLHQLRADVVRVVARPAEAERDAGDGCP